MKKFLAVILAILILVSMTALFSVHADLEKTTYRINNTSFGKDHSDYVSYIVQSDFLRLDVDGAAAKENGTSVAGLYGTVVINVAEAGEYDVTLNLRAHESCGKFELFINNSETKQCDVDMRHSVIGKPANTFFDLEIGKVALIKGENTFKFVSTGEGGTNTAENNRYKANIKTITIARESNYTTFSEGTISATEATAKITQDVEKNYTFNGTIKAADNTESQTPTFTKTGVGGYGEVWTVENVQKGSVFSYQINVETAGTYEISIMSRLHDKGFGEFRLVVDGTEYGSYLNKYTSGAYHAQYTLGTVELTAGEHTVSFKAIGTGARGREDNNVWGADYFTLKHITTDYTIGSNDFSAFISARSTVANSHDLRLIVAADFETLLSYQDLYMIVTFLDQDGNASKTLVKNVETELEYYAAATAAGNKYTAADGSILFGCVITDIPDTAWDGISVSIGTSADAESIFVKGLLSVSEIIG